MILPPGTHWVRLTSITISGASYPRWVNVSAAKSMRRTEDDAVTIIQFGGPPERSWFERVVEPPEEIIAAALLEAHSQRFLVSDVETAARLQRDVARKSEKVA